MLSPLNHGLILLHTPHMVRFLNADSSYSSSDDVIRCGAVYGAQRITEEHSSYRPTGISV